MGGVGGVEGALALLADLLGGAVAYRPGVLTLQR